MNLIIDIGNTRTKLFAFEADEPIAHAVAEGCTLDGLHTFVTEAELAQKSAFCGAIVCTTADLPAHALQQLDSLSFPMLTFSSATPIPLTNHYGTPRTLGPDRIAAAVGAWSHKPGHPLLIIDAGSCITIDFVSATGIYEGGNISPGLHMRLSAMHEHTAHLPLADIQDEVPDLGHDTLTALRAGALWGIRHEIEGYIRQFSAKYPDLFVFLTGGDEISLDKCEENRTFADQFLVARGLNRILTFNQNLANHQQ